MVIHLLIIISKYITIILWCKRKTKGYSVTGLSLYLLIHNTLSNYVHSVLLNKANEDVPYNIKSHRNTREKRDTRNEEEGESDVKESVLEWLKILNIFQYDLQ